MEGDLSRLLFRYGFRCGAADTAFIGGGSTLSGRRAPVASCGPAGSGHGPHPWDSSEAVVVDSVGLHVVFVELGTDGVDHEWRSGEVDLGVGEVR